MVYTKQQEANYRARYGKNPPSAKRAPARSAGRSKKWVFQADADIPMIGKGKVFIDSQGNSRVAGVPATSTKKSSVSRSAAPVQMGSVTRQAGSVTLPTNRGIVIEQREFLTSVQIPSGSTYYSFSYTVNPGLASIFSWASRMASQYTKYRLSIEFVYEPTCPSITRGSITMIFDRNVTAPIPDSKAQAFAYENAVSSNIWMPSKYNTISTVNELFIRTGSLSPGQDQKTYDMGQFIVVVTDADALVGAQDFGNIFINYKLTLLDTKLIDTAGDFMVDTSPVYPYPEGISFLPESLTSVYPYSYLPTSRVYGDAEYYIEGISGLTPGEGDDGSAVIIGFPQGGYYKIVTTLVGDDTKTYNGLDWWIPGDPTAVEMTPYVAGPGTYYGVDPGFYLQQMTQYARVTAAAEPYGGAGIIGGWIYALNLACGVDPVISLNVSITQVSQTQAAFFNEQWKPIGSDASFRMAHTITHPVRLGRKMHKQNLPPSKLSISNSSAVDAAKQQKEDEPETVKETDEEKIAKLERQLNDLRYKK